MTRHHPLTEAVRSRARVGAPRYTRRMFQGFAGWHLIIVVGVLLLIVGIVALIIYVVTRSRAVTDQTTSPQAMPQSIESRLAELESLRTRGVISDDEYARQRRVILGEI